MGLSVENLVIAVVLVLPGFVSAAIRARYQPGGDALSVSWLGLCLLRSLAFNLVLVLPFSRAVPEVLDLTLLASAKAGTLPAGINTASLVVYCLLLYAVAFLWGHAPVVPLLRRLQAGLWAGGTIDPDTSVFRQALVELLQRPRRHGLLTTLFEALGCVRAWIVERVPAVARRRLAPAWAAVAGIFGPLYETDPDHGLWLLVRRGDGRRILGRIVKSSARIDSSGPFEALLFPAAEVDKQGRLIAPSIDPDALASGFYLRVQPSDEVFFYQTAPDWLPPQLAAAAPPPAAPPPAGSTP